MGANLLLVYVICQTVITELSGLTLPFSDITGKVISVTSKPLPPTSSQCSPPITKSSLLWDGEDKNSKLLSPVASGLVFREFSSPITFTSSSRALPVPKVDSSSMKDVKLPERLGKKLLPCNDPASSITPNICPPKVSLPYKYPFLSSPSKLSNTLPLSSSEMYSTLQNKLSSLPCVQSLPHVPLETPKRSGNNLNPTSKTNNVLSTPVIRSKSAPELLTPNSLPLSSAKSLPYPLYYKSMCLPGVITPEPLPFGARQTSYTETVNFNLESQISNQNSFNSPSERYKPSSLPCLNPIKMSDISKPVNMVSISKIPNNVPSLTQIAFSTQNSPVKNIWLPQVESSTASVSFKSSIPLPQSSNHIFSSTIADKISDTYTTIRSPKTSPATEPSPPFASSRIQSNSFDFDVLRNCTKTIDNTQYFSTKIPNINPVVDTLLKSKATMHSNHLNRYDQNILNPAVFIPEIISYQSPISENCASNAFTFSPPIIPHEPTPTTYSTVSSFSPISYITPPSTPSIAQSISTITPSFNDIVSNIVQSILSPYKSYLNSITENIKLQINSKFNAYVYSALEPQQSPVTLSQGNDVTSYVEPVYTNLVSPKFYSPIDYTNSPAIDFSTFTSIDTPFTSSIQEMSSSELSPVSSSHASTVAMLPPFIGTSSPSLCPSYLPSPTLPSTASPFYTQTPVFKSSSSKKDSDVERLLETMLISEILSDDDNFDWDDLDTFLALLSLS